MKKIVDGVEVDLTKDEIDDFNQREIEHNQKIIDYEKVAYQDRRRGKYNARGATNEARIDALWEKLLENRPEEADRLEAIRQQVKAEEPKPS